MSAGDVSPFLQKEFVNLLCGKMLGEGIGRQVYEHKYDDTLVFKFESASNSFQNVHEWDVWERIKLTEHAKWFAPCIAISPCGGVLMQRRTQPAFNYPSHVPSFFTDLKITNYGMLLPKDKNDSSPPLQFVCHDYGVNLLMEHGMTKRMRKADWWNL